MSNPTPAWSLSPAKALGALAVVWAVGAAIVFGPRLLPQDEDGLARLTTSPAFQADMVNRSPDNCIALQHQKPDTVIIGSSHVYAGVDLHSFTEAAREAGYDGKIGVCALSTFNTRYLAPLMSYLKRHDVEPDRIIWLVDTGAFSELALHDRRMDYMMSVFDGEKDAEVRKGWQQRWLDEGRDQSTVFYDDQHHVDQLAELDPNTVAALARQHKTRFSALAVKAAKTAEPMPGWKRDIRDFCSTLAKRGIRLDVVRSPVSLTMPDTPGLIDAVADARTYLPCAKRVEDRDAAQWGLDERDFLNRMLVEDYPYEIWQDASGAAMAAHLAPLEPQDGDRLIDTDHLNPIAARKFGRELARAIFETPEAR